MFTKDNLHKYSLDEWEYEFADIYGNVDLKRSPAEIWLLLMEDASKFSEFIRRDKYADALNALAHVYNWTCSFFWRLRKPNNLHVLVKEPLSDVFWRKYPTLCSYCVNNHCICSARRIELEELPPNEKENVLKHNEEIIRIARNKTEKKPKTLDDWTMMIKDIYKGAHYPVPVESIAFHFMEEVGEVSSCIRKLRERDWRKSGKSKRQIKQINKEEEHLVLKIEEEISDVLSWINSLILKLDHMLGAGVKFTKMNQKIIDVDIEQTANLKLSEILWTAFQTPDGNSLYCPNCKHRPCRCQPFTF